LIITYVRPDDVAIIADDLRPVVEGVIPYAGNRYTADDLIGQCSRGELILWVIHEEGKIIAFVGAISVQYPLKSVLSLQFCAGERMDEWLDDYMAVAVETAKDMGCSCIELAGRKGWERVMARFGFRHYYSSFEMDVE
jgi:hypothetical protein